MSKYKLAIVMRTDLDMGKGKMCVQAGHACTIMGNEMRKGGIDMRILSEWFNEGQFKICLKAESYAGGSQQEWIKDLQFKADEAGLPTVRVYDKGLTQVEPDTLTCIAIGPSLSEDVDKVVGGLKLL